jgi:hypothetical protein
MSTAPASARLDGDPLHAVAHRVVALLGEASVPA